MIVVHHDGITSCDHFFPDHFPNTYLYPEYHPISLFHLTLFSISSFVTHHHPSFFLHFYVSPPPLPRLLFLIFSPSRYCPTILFPSPPLFQTLIPTSPQPTYFSPMSSPSLQYFPTTLYSSSLSSPVTHFSSNISTSPPHSPLFPSPSPCTFSNPPQLCKTHSTQNSFCSI